MTANALSITAYHQLIREGRLTPKCATLIRTYLTHGILADYEAAGLLGWDKSEVSARRNDLMLKDAQGRCTGTGLVTEFGTKFNERTGREVNTYRANVVYQSTLF